MSNGAEIQAVDWAGIALAIVLAAALALGIWDVVREFRRIQAKRRAQDAHWRFWHVHTYPPRGTHLPALFVPAGSHEAGDVRPLPYLRFAVPADRDLNHAVREQRYHRGAQHGLRALEGHHILHIEFDGLTPQFRRGISCVIPFVGFHSAITGETKANLSGHDTHLHGVPCSGDDGIELYGQLCPGVLDSQTRFYLGFAVGGAIQPLRTEAQKPQANRSDGEAPLQRLDPPLAQPFPDSIHAGTLARDTRLAKEASV